MNHDERIIALSHFVVKMDMTRDFEGNADLDFVQQSDFMKYQKKLSEQFDARNENV